MMLDWDDEVDVVCLGGGAAALAGAIAAVDVDAEIYVAIPGDAIPGDGSPAPATLTDAWLGADVSDPETIDYFAALSDDLEAVNLAAEAAVPVREVAELPPLNPRHQVEPFFGSRLRDWAEQCLGSPFGLLHTRVSDWAMTPMRTSLGEAIEVRVIGSYASDQRLSGRDVVHWLAAQASDYDITVRTDHRLQRLVFEEGTVAGAVLTTPHGLRSIRARHGITMTPALPVTDAAAALELRHRQHELRIGLVSQAASRFARLEILAAAPSGDAGSNAGPDVTSEGQLPPRRRRKLQRYPTLGE